MTAQQRGILDRLAQFGWEVVAKEDLLVWWADEVWVLKSVWSPRETRLYLTFIVDPQSEVTRRKKVQDVWAVKASTTLPTQWQKAEGEMEFSLGRGWQDRLEAFLSGFSVFRDGRVEPADEANRLGDERQGW